MGILGLILTILGAILLAGLIGGTIAMVIIQSKLKKISPKWMSLCLLKFGLKHPMGT